MVISLYIVSQITHTLSVSLNKIGDLKYYDGDLQASRSYYFRSLNVRHDAVKDNPNVPSLVSNFSWLMIMLSHFFVQGLCYHTCHRLCFVSFKIQILVACIYFWFVMAWSFSTTFWHICQIHFINLPEISVTR